MKASILFGANLQPSVLGFWSGKACRVWKLVSLTLTMDLDLRNRHLLSPAIFSESWLWLTSGTFQVLVGYTFPTHLLYSYITLWDSFGAYLLKTFAELGLKSSTLKCVVLTTLLVWRIWTSINEVILFIGNRQVRVAEILLKIFGIILFFFISNIRVQSALPCFVALEHIPLRSLGVIGSRTYLFRWFKHVRGSYITGTAAMFCLVVYLGVWRDAGTTQCSIIISIHLGPRWMHTMVGSFAEN